MSKERFNGVVYPMGYDSVLRIKFHEKVTFKFGDELIIIPQDFYDTFDIYIDRKEEHAKEGEDVS